MKPKPFDDGTWTPHGSTRSFEPTKRDGIQSAWWHVTDAKQDWWKTAKGASPESDVDRRTGPSVTFEVDASRNFEAGVWLAGEWTERFNQGTLFVHAGPRPGEPEQNWLKVGVEYEEETEFLGSVVASPYSDWSILKAPVSTNTTSEAKQSNYIWVQVQRHGPDMILHYSFISNTHSAPNHVPDKKDLVLLREVKGFDQFLADGSRPSQETWRVGVMTCGPMSQQTKAVYSGFHFAYTE